MSPAARQSYIAFADHIEGQLGTERGLAPVRALANKLPEHSARLGAVLALVENLDRPDLDVASLECGILLAEHYAAEARRLQDAGQSSPELDLAQRVLEWLTIEWSGSPLISAPDLYTFGPGPVRDKKTATRILDILEDHGWLVREEGAARVNGAMRREVWQLALGTAR